MTTENGDHASGIASRVDHRSGFETCPSRGELQAPNYKSNQKQVFLSGESEDVRRLLSERGVESISSARTGMKSASAHLPRRAP